MGVYIKGMEIPKPGRYEATIYIGDDGTSCIAVSPEAHDIGYWDEYSFISVPEHGRLGDLDELKKRLKKPVTMDANRAERLWEGWHECTIGVKQTIDALPTIIPADRKEEGKL